MGLSKKKCVVLSISVSFIQQVYTGCYCRQCRQSMKYGLTGHQCVCVCVCCDVMGKNITTNKTKQRSREELGRNYWTKLWIEKQAVWLSTHPQRTARVSLCGGKRKFEEQQCRHWSRVETLGPARQPGERQPWLWHRVKCGTGTSDDSHRISLAGGKAQCRQQESWLTGGNRTRGIIWRGARGGYSVLFQLFIGLFRLSFSCFMTLKTHEKLLVVYDEMGFQSEIAFFMTVQTTFLIPEMDHLIYELLNTGLKKTKTASNQILF